jgi:hypothetical protein
VHKAAARTKDTEASQYEISQDDLRAALEKVKKEELPRSQEQSEAYFMGQVNLGEQLSSQGQSPAGLFARPIPDLFILESQVPILRYKPRFVSTELCVSILPRSS